MSDNPTSNGHNQEFALHKQNQPEVARVACAECGNALEIIESPYTVLNSLTHSVLIVEHKDAIICGGCGAVYTTGINARAKPVVSLILVKQAERRILTPADLM